MPASSLSRAPPGKTEVVVSRIDNLVQNEGLTASEEILVLSFPAPPWRRSGTDST